MNGINIIKIINKNNITIKKLLILLIELNFIIFIGLYNNIIGLIYAVIIIILDKIKNINDFLKSSDKFYV